MCVFMWVCMHVCVYECLASCNHSNNFLPLLDARGTIHRGHSSQTLGNTYNSTTELDMKTLINEIL